MKRVSQFLEHFKILRALRGKELSGTMVDKIIFLRFPGTVLLKNIPHKLLIVTNEIGTIKMLNFN